MAEVIYLFADILSDYRMSWDRLSGLDACPNHFGPSNHSGHRTYMPNPSSILVNYWVCSVLGPFGSPVSSERASEFRDIRCYHGLMPVSPGWRLLFYKLVFLLEKHAFPELWGRVARPVPGRWLGCPVTRTNEFRVWTSDSLLQVSWMQVNLAAFQALHVPLMPKNWEYKLSTWITYHLW